MYLYIYIYCAVFVYIYIIIYGNICGKIYDKFRWRISERLQTLEMSVYIIMHIM